MENFEIAAGTYEEFLIGYKYTSSGLIQSFASHDHSSSIRALASCEQFLASGATDDRIIIYDLKTRKEHCMLTHHNSTVTCLAFTNNHTHLMTGSTDGTLAVVKTGSWAVEKIWEKAHKGFGIHDIAIHPSGKLALTLGADKTLRTWNLIKGRQAYAINLNSKSKDATSLEKIIWAEDGVQFILYGGRYTEIWSIKVGGILETIDHSSKASSCLWFSKEEILVGYENGELNLVNISTSSKNIHKAHESRVKVLTQHKSYIVSASSSGEIKVWNRDFDNLAKINSGCRITCLTIINDIYIKKEEVEEIEDDIVEPVKKDQKTHVVVEVENDDDDSVVRESKKKKRKNKVSNAESEDSKKSGKGTKKKKDKRGEIKSIEIDANGEEKPKKKKKNKQLEENLAVEDVSGEEQPKKKKKKLEENLVDEDRTNANEEQPKKKKKKKQLEQNIAVEDGINTNGEEQPKKKKKKQLEESLVIEDETNGSVNGEEITEKKKKHKLGIIVEDKPNMKTGKLDECIEQSSSESVHKKHKKKKNKKV